MVAQEWGCSGGERSGFNLEPIPQRSLFPPGSQIQSVGLFRRLGDFLRRGGEKTGKKIERIGQRIKDFFGLFQPSEQS